MSQLRPIGLGAYGGDPQAQAAQQQMLQQRAAEQERIRQALAARAQAAAQEQQARQAAAAMQQGGAAGGAPPANMVLGPQGGAPVRMPPGVTAGMLQGAAGGAPQANLTGQLQGNSMGGGMASAAGGGAASPSMMQQLGTFGSPLNSALLNFGLETMNAGQQGRSTMSSLASGLGGGAGGYIAGKQLEKTTASQDEKDEMTKRLLGLQEMALRNRLDIAGGAGNAYSPVLPSGWRAGS